MGKQSHIWNYGSWCLALCPAYSISLPHHVKHHQKLFLVPLCTPLQWETNNTGFRRCHRSPHWSMQIIILPFCPLVARCGTCWYLYGNDWRFKFFPVWRHTQKNKMFSLLILWYQNTSKLIGVMYIKELYNINNSKKGEKRRRLIWEKWGEMVALDWGAWVLSASPLASEGDPPSEVMIIPCSPTLSKHSKASSLRTPSHCAMFLCCFSFSFSFSF